LLWKPVPKHKKGHPDHLIRTPLEVLLIQPVQTNPEFANRRVRTAGSEDTEHPEDREAAQEVIRGEREVGRAHWWREIDPASHAAHLRQGPLTEDFQRERASEISLFRKRIRTQLGRDPRHRISEIIVQKPIHFPLIQRQRKLAEPQVRAQSGRFLLSGDQITQTSIRPRRASSGFREGGT